MDTDVSAGAATFAPNPSELLFLFEQAGLGILSVDSCGRVLYANPTAAQLIGRTTQNLVGDSLADIAPTTKEREIQLSLMPELASGANTDYSLLFGERIDIRVQEAEDGRRLLLLRDRREPQRSPSAANFARRAAEISTAEERLAESQRVAEIGSWERDLITGVISWSREMYRILDCDPFGAEPLGEEARRKFDEEDIAWFESACEEASLRGGEFSRDMRVSLSERDSRWVHLRGRAIGDGWGNYVRLVGTLQNVTARKTVELQQDVFLRTAIEVADHDALTGLLNHRAFHHYLRAGAERLETVRRSSPVGNMPSMAIVVMDMDNFKYFNDTYGHLTGDDVLAQVAAAIQSCCSEGDMPARIGGDEFGICLPRITRDAYHSFLTRLRATTDAVCYEPRGKAVSIPIRVSIGAALFPDEAPTFADALYLADKRAILDKGGAHDSDAERLRAVLSQEMDGFSMLDALVAAVDNKDRYTRRHSEEVMLYCAAIADHLGLQESEKNSLQTAALVHDVGKIGVPNRVLRLPTKLSAAQFDVVKRHPVLGGILVSAVPELNHTLGAVRHHHERWDGHGYPSGLAGEGIPLPARIMAVADAYSAMTNDRPYRKGMPATDAERILAEGAGTQWDPSCVQAFLASRQTGSPT